MEEQIITYTNQEDIPRIITELNSINYLLVEHKTQEKKLYFKRFSKKPETLIQGENQWY